ncbi:MAG: dephospho-CoA kinase [Oxalobacter sp.]|nr:MAG: dephospho-CoA kinase [Oxalobacter sp.]
MRDVHTEARPDLPATPGKFIVGLTGGIGSGKTTVANLFAERGAAVIDTDVVAHQLTAPGGLAISAIRDTFGETFINADGAMDRAKMRAQVFANPDAKTQLEAILHPLIRKEVERAAEEASAPYVIFVVPLLVGSDYWQKRVSRVLVVDCPEALQIQRVMQRNAMTREQVLAIMATQATRAARLAAADDIVVNEGGLETLVPAVERLHAHYLALSAQFLPRK